MDAGIIDLIIIILLFLGGVVGFKEGVFKKLASFIGLFLVVIIAFTLKNKLSVYFYENLPFLDLWGVFKGVQVLNVLFYEVIAFLIIASVLMIVYRVIITFTGLIEKVLKATVILTIPSKILGMVVGVIESYFWIYVFLFIMTLPIINFRDVYESNMANFIMKNTPVLSKYTKKSVDLYNDVYEIVDSRKDKTNNEINEETMDLMLKYDIITVESAEKLIKKNKVEVSDDYIINK